MRIRIANSGLSGFTLVELLVVLAILSAITGVMVMTFSMATNITLTDTAQSLLLSHVHQAGAWIARDVQSADTVVPVNSSTRLLQVHRNYWNGSAFDNTTVVYYDIGADGIMTRTMTNSSGTNTGPVAQFIKYPDAGTSFIKGPATAAENNTYILNIKAEQSGTSFSAQYKMQQRIPPQ